jgi:hypothetical protein
VELDGGAHLLCGFLGEKEPNIGDRVNVNKMHELYYCEPNINP